MPALTWRALAAGLLAACLLTSCGAPARQHTDGTRRTLATAAGSVVVPAGWLVLDPQTWALPLGSADPVPGQALFLRLQVTPEPEGGATAHVNRLLADIERQGQAGVLRDQVVALGDLDGRLIEAADLPPTTRGQGNPQALWLVVVVAEDGMYTASATGPAAELKARRPLLEAFLLSVRVAAPGGKPRPQPVAPDPLGLADPLAGDWTPTAKP